MRNTKINFNNKGRSFKSLLLIGFCSFNLSAFSHTNMLYAQSQSFTIEMTNTTVKGVFDYIEANSEFVFLYDKNAINLNKQVNMNVKGRPIQDVLDEVLEGQDVVYEINDRQIALKKASNCPRYTTDHPHQGCGKRCYRPGYRCQRSGKRHNEWSYHWYGWRLHTGCKVW